MVAFVGVEGISQTPAWQDDDAREPGNTLRWSSARRSSPSSGPRRFLELAYILAMGFNEPLDEGAMCGEQLVKDRAVSG